MTPRVVDTSVFAALSPPRLAGSRCGQCGTTVFPRRPTCPRCGEPGEPLVLAAHGRIWSWTVQHFAPKSPYRPAAGDFTPFAVGYVDLGDVMVETRLALPPAGMLQIGQPVRLTLLPVWLDPDGVEVATFAFTPDDSGGRRA
jgi:uncharacterized OB-fold protein